MNRLLSFLLALSLNCGAAQYWVAPYPTGNDAVSLANNSQESPWATIGHAASVVQTDRKSVV